MKRVVVEPVGWPCGLHECPPGLFSPIGKDGPETSGIGLKTEYRTSDGRTEAYVVESGEFWQGGAKTVDAREAMLVQPLRVRVEEDGS